MSIDFAVGGSRSTNKAPRPKAQIQTLRQHSTGGVLDLTRHLLRNLAPAETPSPAAWLPKR
jgi:hypothetical protein